jgi:hypothetical protein
MKVDFEGRGFDTPTDQSSLTYLWDFGDGTTSSAPSTYRYYSTSTSDTYTASLTVTDQHDSSDVYQITVNVKVDTDGDRLLDGDELEMGLDPENFDTDGDWLIDSYEFEPPYDPDYIPPDGMPRTDPTLADMDFDGCTDWEEIWPGEDGYITSPYDPDSDDDGLKDCDEMFVRSFRSDERFKIPDYELFTSDIGKVIVPVYNVKTDAPESTILRAEARFGITHGKVGDLKLKVGYDDDTGGSISELLLVDYEQIEETSKTIRERTSSEDENIFDAVDLLSIGFSATDFTGLRTWGLIVEDHESGGGCHVEYFYILLYTATGPWDKDSDNDGLIYAEEAGLGRYGWLTDPWDADTDGDTISDYLEVTGWKRSGSSIVGDGDFRTDPTRMDTDRDGYSDRIDYGPLHNLMIRLDLLTMEALGQDTPEALFYHVCFNPEGETITHEDQCGNSGWTDFYTDHVDEDGDDPFLEYYKKYTLDVPDDERYSTIVLILWEDSDGGDDVWDIHPGPGKGGKQVTYDILDDEETWITSGHEEGEDVHEHDAEVTFKISTVYPSRVTTAVISSTEPDSLYEPTVGQPKYTGEDEYFFFMLDITDGSGNPSYSNLFVTEGIKTLIVQRSVFIGSRLNHVVQTTTEPDNLPDRLKELEFLYYDDAKDSTTGSISGYVNGALTGDDAYSLLDDLLHDVDGRTIGQSTIVTDPTSGSSSDPLLTMNIADDVVLLVPFVEQPFDNLGDDPEGTFESIGEAFGDWWHAVAELMKDVVMVIAGAVVWITEVIVDFSLMILGKLWDAIVWIAEAIRDIAKTLGGIIVAIVQFVMDPSWESFKNIGKAFLKFIGTVLAIGLEIMLRLCNSYRELNAAEREEAQKVFGREIDLDKVRIFDGALARSIMLPGICLAFNIDIWHGINGGRAFVNGYLINIPEDDIGDYPTLIHELTHVWQATENDGRWVIWEALGSQQEWAGASGYDYDGSRGLRNRLAGFDGNVHKAFASFNPEQQASIMEDYYERRFNLTWQPHNYAAWQQYANVVYRPPSDPHGLTVEVVGNDVILTWESPDGPPSSVVGYDICRSTTSVSYSSTTVGGTTSSTSYTDAGLPSGTFYYIVVALYSGSKSGASNEVSVTIS